MADTAILTGASGGIGRACTRELAADHDVLVHYNSDREGAAEAASAVEEAGNDALVYQCDIADPDAVRGMVTAAESELGPVDVLVNNAGVFLERDIEAITDDEIDLTVDVNLKGTVNCTKAVIPSMRERGHGRVVSIASTAGTHGSPTDPVYAASKGGVISLSKSIAKQHTDDGIHANAVAPGPVATKMMREGRRPGLNADSPIGRLVEPAEVAEAVRFFVDTDAISGRVLEIDGGRII
jgi:3-oxoacyl-[acyl-carrier protein] reductase